MSDGYTTIEMPDAAWGSVLDFRDGRTIDTLDEAVSAREALKQAEVIESSIPLAMALPALVALKAIGGPAWDLWVAMFDGKLSQPQRDQLNEAIESSFSAARARMAAER